MKTSLERVHLVSAASWVENFFTVPFSCAKQIRVNDKRRYKSGWSSLPEAALRGSFEKIS